MSGSTSAESFVAGGMAWRIHRERVLLAGWGRAILLQIAHPKVARGVAEHSAFATCSATTVIPLCRSASAPSG